MSGDDDDYLSDKFLVDNAAASAAPKTYAQIRKEAKKQAIIKNEQNRLKSRHQREIESREEGLSKSLFERAKEEEEAGLGSGNKALSMMMKMGFKPGQSLGKLEQESRIPSIPIPDTEPDPGIINPAVEGKSKSHHKTEPLPLNEWTGKKGIGLGKRARSPTHAERVAKMVKMAEETSHHDFRDRARQEYEERRAEGKLGPAQRTCATLDDRAGKSFNVLWLNPNNPDTFPPGLTDALALHGFSGLIERRGDSIEGRLKRQMDADALQPLGPEGTLAVTKSSSTISDQFSSDVIEEAIQFLRLHAPDRLHLVLSYLRENYAYCFWCGVQYTDEEDMASDCPGAEEDVHD